MLPLVRILLRLLPLGTLCLCAMSLFGLIAPRCDAATTYFVSPTGSDSGSGTLASPFHTIQHGINTAVSGDTVTIEDGTYTGPGNVDLDFGGRNITVTSQNGAAKTIIDCGGFASSDFSGEHRGFYLHSRETNAVISGLTIQNGYEGPNGGGGGGILNFGAGVAILNCILQKNSASDGGGISNFESAYANSNGYATLTNCVISGNSAADGGGIMNNTDFQDKIIVTNCTVTGNTASDNTTGGIYQIGEAITLVNDIVYGNTGGNIGSYASGAPTGGAATHCDIQGGIPTGMIDNGGNIAADPLFADAGHNDFHLKSGSSCLDAGTASGAPTTTIDGMLRPAQPSIGAYETVPVLVPGSDDFFVVTSQNPVTPSNSGSNTVGEYTPTGSYVRTITVPGSTGASSNNGTEYLRGIAVTDAGQLVGFNGTFSPELTTYDPATLAFTSQKDPGWGIIDTINGGSVGVYQGYTFVLNQGPDFNFPRNGILQFNTDGVGLQLNTTNYYSLYSNLAVGMDGKLYALRSNPGGSPYSAWAVDVYDPISLLLLDTINLQLLYTQNMQAVDLQNLAVDTRGSIYAVDLYNYVYHFDANGNLLQSASHGQGGDATDIKIDPFTGNLLIGIAGTPGKIIRTDPMLSSFQTLVTLDPNQFAECFITFSNAKLAAKLAASVPTSLTATAGISSVTLSWTAPTGISGATYSVYRGTTPGGETLYLSGFPWTSVTDDMAAPGTKYYYTVVAVLGSKTSPMSNEASATPLALRGEVRYFPRVGQEIRMVGGLFQGSHDKATWTTLATITTQPTDVWNELPVTIAAPQTFRYLRYLSPNAGYGNVAEIEFYTTDASAKLTGTPFGTAGSYKNNGYVFTKVFDGNTATFFDAPAPGNGDYVGIDQGPPPTVPTGLSATGGYAQITLTWSAAAGAASYALSRGQTAGGETVYQTGLIGKSYVDTAVAPGTTYYYTLQAVNASRISAASNEASATPMLPILGTIRYFPRVGQEIRMVGGLFQGSHDKATWTTLATITTQPTDVWNKLPVTVADPKTFRYLRYLSPNAGYGNVAEIEFYTTDASAKLTGTPFGTAGSYKNNGYVFTKVFDGNTATFFDAPAPGNGDYVGTDQGIPSGTYPRHS